MSNNKRKQYSVQDEIERKEREMDRVNAKMMLTPDAYAEYLRNDIIGEVVEDSNAEAYKLCCKELLDSSSTAEELIDALNRVDYKEYIDRVKTVEDNTPSLDKVMEAIERVEDRGRMNSRHILTLQQAVNTLLDDKIEGTWWSRLMNRNN